MSEKRKVKFWISPISASVLLFGYLTFLASNSPKPNDLVALANHLITNQNIFSQCTIQTSNMHINSSKNQKGKRKNYNYALSVLLWRVFHATPGEIN